VKLISIREMICGRVSAERKNDILE